MKECIYDYFIFNHKSKKCLEFDENEIKEGKSIYEVIRVIDGVPLFIREHLNRLERTIEILNINVNINRQDILEDMYTLINKNNITMGNIKLIINLFEGREEIILFFIKHHYPSEEDYKNGVKTILYHGERKNPNAKIINENFRKKIREELQENQAYEAILVDNEGYITEGSKSNIFMIKEKQVFTAPLKDVLPGITRQVIIKILKDNGIEILEKRIKAEEISNLDALFISGTSPKVLPISQVDDIKFNINKNEILHKIMNEFSKEVIANINNIEKFF